MRRVHLLNAGLIAVCVLAAGLAWGASGTEDLVNSLKAADTWLELLDQGKYAECFSKTAPAFQRSITLQKWEDDLKLVNTKVGKVGKRSLKAVEATTKLPPDNIEGGYFVIEYDTTFTLKKAPEIVTMMLDAKSGSWQVAGYYVR